MGVIIHTQNITGTHFGEFHIHDHPRRKIAESGKELIIRVPVVPGFNNKPEEIEAIAEFAASLTGVWQLHLLPYHRLGQDKYQGLGREYTLKQIVPPTKAEMQRLVEVASRTGLTVQIGG